MSVNFSCDVCGATVPGQWRTKDNRWEPSILGVNGWYTVYLTGAQLPPRYFCSVACQSRQWSDGPPEGGKEEGQAGATTPNAGAARGQA
jgi:hypothetical protein